MSTNPLWFDDELPSLTVICDELEQAYYGDEPTRLSIDPDSMRNWKGRLRALVGLGVMRLAYADETGSGMQCTPAETIRFEGLRELVERVR